jgi:hypothetical protein
MKLVAFDEIYNSVVQFSFEVILRLKKLIYVLKMNLSWVSAPSIPLLKMDSLATPH